MSSLYHGYPECFCEAVLFCIWSGLGYRGLAWLPLINSPMGLMLVHPEP